MTWPSTGWVAEGSRRRPAERSEPFRKRKDIEKIMQKPTEMEEDKSEDQLPRTDGLRNGGIEPRRVDDGRVSIDCIGMDTPLGI